MHEHVSIGGGLAIACSLLSAVVLIVYLIKRPPFTLTTQLWLFLGLGILPLGTALAGNVSGFEATKRVHFCGSCHVMLAHTGDAADPHSQSLAARHSRNNLFGDESCYACHADYGMFGAVFTKINGMHHVASYLQEYGKMPLDDALAVLETFKPFANVNCMQCHSTKNELWLDVADHAGALSDVRSGKVSCASQGCHGYAHPFTKEARELAAKAGKPHATLPAKLEGEEVRP
jgi:cytochrome c-type protein NapC